jgi:anti-sigma B factor antagonist
MDLKTDVVVTDGYRILALRGEIDAATGPALRTLCLELVDDSTLPLLVDMTGVTFCDSTGLNIAAAVRRHAGAKDCVVAFYGFNQRVRKVFRVTGMDLFVPTYATLADAADDLDGDPGGDRPAR